MIHGEAAAAFARPWIGAIQWVAQSPVRPHHKRKNWFIGVFELPAPPEAPKALAAQDVRFEAFRAGGPGGQHQNTTESAVRATHIASGLSVVAREERSQHRNKALALERIAALLRLQERTGSDHRAERCACGAWSSRARAAGEAVQGRCLPGIVASSNPGRKKAVDVSLKPAHDGTKRS